LGLLILLLVGGQFLGRRTPPPAQERASLQGQVLDLTLAAQALLETRLQHSIHGRTPAQVLGKELSGAWDRGLAAVHAAEEGSLDAGEELLPKGNQDGEAALRRAWLWAYRGQGAPPPSRTLDRVREQLGNGYGGRILCARVLARTDPPAAALQAAEARAWAGSRALGFLAALGAISLFALGGLVFGIVQFFLPGSRPALPQVRISGRALALALELWFLGLLSAGPLLGLLFIPAPFLRPLALPLTYALHATFGLWLLCRAEGTRPGPLFRRLAPGSHGKALAWGLGFAAFALACVLAVATALAPLMKHAEPPQRELLDLMARLRGPLALVLTFLTVAVLAPVFEELVFRGFLLPWLDQRLRPRLGLTAGRGAAIALSGFSFALIHLQPGGLPVLAALGMVLGLAFARTGNLLTAILVHGLWNGGVFLMLRLLPA
jgi:membrane protease YdiL (CAAX protease family)